MDIIIDMESTGLDAESSQLIAIGYLTDDGIKRTFFAEKPSDEVKIIESFIQDIRELIDSVDKDVLIVTYYGSHFDMPYFYSRGLKLTAKNLLSIPEIFYQHIDVYDVVKKFLKLSKNGLNDVCKFLGIDKLKEIDGRDMPNIYLEAVAGNNEKKTQIILHLEDDLHSLAEVWKKMKPIVEVVKEF